ncbi:1-deoxy-D-xylulose-5-phosphate synthase N-terminal domain-containing protein, partial [Enterococcus faecium]|uniref:1-deoxy-D-xylulose-5-phosphate synthase N-terminal domain-containing protein n=1 Tax=Enterococcus faecium TaxID=1352 RepID=UPI001CA30AEB
MSIRFCTVLKPGIKDTVVPEPLYSDLGLKYIGPVDGHNQRAIETALKRARDFDGPVIVHAVTRKGEG